jgi:hypothetical protein
MGHGIFFHRGVASDAGVQDLPRLLILGSGTLARCQTVTLYKLLFCSPFFPVWCVLSNKPRDTNWLTTFCAVLLLRQAFSAIVFKEGQHC